MGLLDILRGVADQADFIPGFDPVKDKQGLLSQLLRGRDQYGQTPPIAQPGLRSGAPGGPLRASEAQNQQSMTAPGGSIRNTPNSIQRYKQERQNPYYKYKEPMTFLDGMFSSPSQKAAHHRGHMAFLEHRDMAAKAKQTAQAAQKDYERNFERLYNQAAQMGLKPGAESTAYIQAGLTNPEKLGENLAQQFKPRSIGEGVTERIAGQSDFYQPKTATPLDPQDLALRQQNANAAMIRAQKTTPGVVINTGQPSRNNLPPFQIKQDEIYAETHAEWNTGGAADAVKQLGQLTQVADALESGRDDLTGFLIGITPKWALEGLNPEAVNARELVEEVVQRNLRIVLGAQFTEKEGDRLIARAYNPSLREEVNADRLRRLVASIEARAQQIESLNEFVNRNGTTAGWDGSLSTVDQILSEIEGSGRSGGKPMAGQKRKVYNPATGEFE